METKYGRLFTEDDVVKILASATGMLSAREVVRDHIELIDDATGVFWTFPPDEPLFLLRGQDERARTALNEYLDEIESARDEMELPSAEFRVAVDQAVEEFKAWQDENPGRVKVPS